MVRSNVLEALKVSTNLENWRGSEAYGALKAWDLGSQWASPTLRFLGKVDRLQCTKYTTRYMRALLPASTMSPWVLIRP